MLKTRTTAERSTQKIVAIILLFISFLMLFLPWMNISMKAMGRKLAVQDMLEFMSLNDGIPTAELKSELYDELVELSYELEYEGVYFDPDEAMTTLELICDSKFSLIDAARICSFSGSFLGEMSGYLAENRFFYGENRIISAMADTAEKFSAAAVFLWSYLALMVCSFIYAVCSVLKEKKAGAVFFLCVEALLLFLFFVFTVELNEGLNRVADTFSNEAANFLEEFGIDYFSLKRITLFHMSGAGIFSVLFAIGALCIPLMERCSPLAEKIMGAEIHIPKFPSVGAWHCASCGASMGAEAAFCTACGSKRPEALRCSACGSPLKKEMAFCPNCGARTSAGIGSVRPESGKACPKCGNKVSLEAEACSFCGYQFKVRSESKLWGTLPISSDDTK